MKAYHSVMIHVKYASERCRKISNRLTSTKCTYFRGRRQLPWKVFHDQSQKENYVAGLGIELATLEYRPEICSAANCARLFSTSSIINMKPEDHWSCIAHLIAEDMLKSAVIEEKKFKNIECK